MLARALSDQRIEEFMVMQESIMYKRPHRGVYDGWEWIGAPSSIRGAYKRLCEKQYMEDRSIIRACWCIWQQKVPLKVRLFRWFVLQKRLITRVLHRRLYPGTSADCNHCLGAEEDSALLFFGCPFAQTIDKPF